MSLSSVYRLSSIDECRTCTDICYNVAQWLSHMNYSISNTFIICESLCQIQSNESLIFALSRMQNHSSSDEQNIVQIPGTEWADLPQVMDQLIRNDRDAEKLAMHSQKFWRKNLSSARVSCYYRRMFKMWASVQSQAAILEEGATDYESFSLMGQGQLPFCDSHTAVQVPRSSLESVKMNGTPFLSRCTRPKASTVTIQLNSTAL